MQTLFSPVMLFEEIHETVKTFKKTFEDFLQALLNINDAEKHSIETLYDKNMKLLKSNLRSRPPNLSMIKTHLSEKSARNMKCFFGKSKRIFLWILSAFEFFSDQPCNTLVTL